MHSNFEQFYMKEKRIRINVFTYDAATLSFLAMKAPVNGDILE